MRAWIFSAGRRTSRDEVDAQETVIVRRLEDGDWPRLSLPFAASFRRVQPFAGLSDRRRLGRAGLPEIHPRGKRRPDHSPGLPRRHEREPSHPVGAILVTLVPPVDLDDFWSLRWKTPPPPDSVESRLGHAHLTWIFVGPMHAGYGVGTALLARAAQGLLELGYTELVSSFILGNDSSMLWHWRNGFQLLPYAGSKRKFREMMCADKTQGEGAT